MSSRSLDVATTTIFLIPRLLATARQHKPIEPAPYSEIHSTVNCNTCGIVDINGAKAYKLEASGYSQEGAGMLIKPAKPMLASVFSGMTVTYMTSSNETKNDLRITKGDATSRGETVNEYPDLSAIFEKMAMTEMRHFVILGRMVICLGGDPAIRTRHSNPFFGRPDRLERQLINKMLTCSLENEQAAIKNYTRLASAMSADKVATMLLERIVADEEHHARMLSRALGDM